MKLLHFTLFSKLYVTFHIQSLFTSRKEKKNSSHMKQKLDLKNFKF